MSSRPTWATKWVIRQQTVSPILCLLWFMVYFHNLFHWKFILCVAWYKDLIFFKKAYISSIFLSIFLQCSLNWPSQLWHKALPLLHNITWGLWSVWMASVLYRWSLCIIARVQIIWKLLAARIWDLTRSSKDFWFFVRPSSPDVRSCTVANLPK